MATQVPRGVFMPKNGMWGRALRRTASFGRALNVPSSPSEFTQ